MEDREILSMIDHTLLTPTATRDEVIRLCDEAIRWGCASVCIPPSYVDDVCSIYGRRLTVCTVVGFPLGYSTTQAKCAEATAAIAGGATEIDTVINITDVKNGRYSEVEDELRALRHVCHGVILKVIVETCYLTQDEKVRLCELVTASGADFIKTSTGFGTAGATLEDVRLFKEHIGEGVRIKAAGGVRTIEEARAFIEAGASRLGSSKVAPLLAEKLGL